MEYVFFVLALDVDRENPKGKSSRQIYVCGCAHKKGQVRSSEKFTLLFIDETLEPGSIIICGENLIGVADTPSATCTVPR